MLKVTRTLLAPSEQEAVSLYARVLDALKSGGSEAVRELGIASQYVFTHASKTSVRLVEHFNTGGSTLYVESELLPASLGKCDAGRSSAWPCRADATEDVASWKWNELIGRGAPRKLCAHHAREFERLYRVS